MVVADAKDGKLSGIVTEPFPFPSCCSCSLRMVSDRSGFQSPGRMSTRSRNATATASKKNWRVLKNWAYYLEAFLNSTSSREIYSTILCNNVLTTLLYWLLFLPKPIRWDFSFGFYNSLGQYLKKGKIVTFPVRFQSSTSPKMNDWPWVVPIALLSMKSLHVDICSLNISLGEHPSGFANGGPETVFWFLLLHIKPKLSDWMSDPLSPRDLTSIFVIQVLLF